MTTHPIVDQRDIPLRPLPRGNQILATCFFGSDTDASTRHFSFVFIGMPAGTKRLAIDWPIRPPVCLAPHTRHLISPVRHSTKVFHQHRVAAETQITVLE